MKAAEITCYLEHWLRLQKEKHPLRFRAVLGKSGSAGDFDPAEYHDPSELDDARPHSSKRHHDRLSPIQENGEDNEQDDDESSHLSDESSQSSNNESNSSDDDDDDAFSRKIEQEMRMYEGSPIDECAPTNRVDISARDRYHALLNLSKDVEYQKAVIQFGKCWVCQVCIEHMCLVLITMHQSHLTVRQETILGWIGRLGPIGE